jgi:hypothetical protein
MRKGTIKGTLAGMILAVTITVPTALTATPAHAADGGGLWAAFTKGIEAGRNKEILNERADYWVAHSTQTLNTTRPQP